jgi:hypothetical protein
MAGLRHFQASGQPHRTRETMECSTLGTLEVTTF